MKLFGINVFGSEKKSAPTATGNFFPSTKENSSYSYNESVQNLYKACSIIVCCLRVYQFKFWEPPLQHYTKDGKPLLTSRLQTLLNNPNPNQSQSELMTLIATYLVLWGNAFLQIVTNKSGLVSELWAYSEETIFPVLENGLIARYKKKKINSNDFEYIDAAYIIHFRSPIVDLDRTYLGKSAIQLLAREAGVDAQLTRFLNAYLKKNAQPGGVVFLDKDLDVQQEDLDLYKQKFNENFSGDGAGDTMVVHGGNDYKSLVPAIKDFQTDKLRFFSESRVCGAMGIPPQMAYLMSGNESSTYNNITTVKLGCTEDTFVPLWKYVAEKFDKLAKFFSDTDVIRFDLSQVESLKMKRAEQMKQYDELIMKYGNLYAEGKMMRESAIMAMLRFPEMTKEYAESLFPEKDFSVTPAGEIVSQNV